MFDDWKRADVISALALLVSAFAFVVSLGALRYSATQAGIAKRRERAELKALEPAVEASLHAVANRPGCFFLQLHLRNRTNVAIACDELRVLEPEGALLITERDASEGKRNEFGLVWPETFPIERMRSAIDPGRDLAPVGTVFEAGKIRARQDEAHIGVLVFVPSTRFWRSPTMLRTSLKVRRKIESVVFAEIVIKTKIPVVVTSTET